MCRSSMPLSIPSFNDHEGQQVYSEKICLFNVSSGSQGKKADITEPIKLSYPSNSPERQLFPSNFKQLGPSHSLPLPPSPPKRQ